MTQPAPAARRQNIELKARVADLPAARRTAAALCAEPPQRERQTDTYFDAPRGRLKLREIEGRGAWLIAYSRANEAAARSSDYRLVNVVEPEALHAALADALGVKIVVAKDREIFLYNNVRIHLDRVESLGTFIEFEAVIGPHDTVDEGHQQLAVLSERFGLSAADLVPLSYSDLLQEAVG